MRCTNLRRGDATSCTAIIGAHVQEVMQTVSGRHHARGCYSLAPRCDHDMYLHGNYQVGDGRLRDPIKTRRNGASARAQTRMWVVGNTVTV